MLITVLSVMNGFDLEIHKRFFGMAPEITVNGHEDRISDWQALEQRLSTVPHVKAIAPYVGGQGLLTYEGQVSPVIVTGILPEKEKAITHIKDKILVGDLDKLQPFGIILGKGLAENLNLIVGDKVSLMIPEASVTPAGMMPRFKRFTVVGIFSAGSGFNFDSKLAFIHLADAQKLFKLGSDVSGLKLRIDDIYRAPAMTESLRGSLGEYYQVGDWTDSFGAFFHAVKMEKTMMFLILVLIIAVAAFNLVSSLVMIVNDKQAEIAILRTLGATPSMILRVFMIQGLIIGGIGTLLGLIGGLILASNATAIVTWLQGFFNIQVLSSNIYFVDFLPSKIMVSDLILVCITALSLSFLATLYPSFRASRTIIAEALHYE